MTLSHWLKGTEAYNFDPWSATRIIRGAVYVPDCRAIESSRTWLWSLDDYLVSSVSGGSIVLIPRSDTIRPLLIVQCADCGRRHDGNEVPSHTCRAQIRANRRAQKARTV